MPFHDLRIEVEKLKGSIYGDWKFAEWVMLKERGLWKNINGTAISPARVDIKRCELYDKERDLAYSLIVQFINKGQNI